MLDGGKKGIKFALPAIILLFVYSQTHSFIKQMRPSLALHIMGKLHTKDHLLLLAVSMAAVAAMAGYDWLFARWNQARLPLRSVLRIGWIAGTFNNLMGFGGFTGAGLRSLMYKKRDIGGSGIIRSIVYLSLSMLTGLSVLGILLLTGLLRDEGMFREHIWLLLVVAGISCYLFLFLLIDRLRTLRRWFGLDETEAPRWTRGLSAVAVSTIEWLAAAAVFYTVIHTLGGGIGFREAAGIYAIAAMAGVASFVPGGLGSFDVIALLGLQTAGMSPEHALAVVLLFRIFYYFIPWCIGLALAAVEWTPDAAGWSQLSDQVLRPAVRRWHFLWNWPGQSAILQDTGAFALAALVFSAGGVLLVSGATPGDWSRMHWLEHFVTPLTMKGSHELSTLVGLAMLLISNGIRLRVKRAYDATLLLLAGGVVFSLLKGVDYEEAVFLGIVFALLWISKNRFTRLQAVYSLRSVIGWAAATLVVMLLYSQVGQWTNDVPHRFVHAKLYARYAVHDPQFVREAVLGVVLGWLALTGSWLLRPRLPAPERPSAGQLAKLSAFLQRYNGNYLTHLLFVGDKRLLWSSDDKAVVAIGQYGRTAVALGDPIGEPASVRRLVGEFRDDVYRFAGTPVFYQVAAAHLPVYHEYGFRFFKLGEEAIVSLADFQLSGKRRADLRATVNRFEREGYTFAIVRPPFGPDLMAELKEVSDGWLGGRAEKGFSLGTFNEAYLQRAPIAILSDRDGRTAAFASFMPVYDGDETVSIDLMRYRTDIRSGVMDALFVHMLQWAKAEGYARFNLGMAPLASVGESVYSHRSERMARWIYLKGSHFYHFQGLRKFKEKYDPVWEPRYLAYPQKVWLPLLMLRITKLISRGQTGSKGRAAP